MGLSDDATAEIRDLRKRIDAVDCRIMTLLRQREDFAVRVMFLKQQAGLPLRDLKRESEVMGRAREWDELMRRRICGALFALVLNSSRLLAREMEKRSRETT